MDHDASLPVRVRRRLVAALEWYGPGRAVTAVGSILVVCVGAWWLLRAPAPPLENSLPFAGVAASATGAPGLVSPTLTVTSAVSPAAVINEDDEITVHVVGEVVAPGVYTLPVGSRVVDSVIAAGGPNDLADTSALNMALPLSDSDQVYVPSRAAVQQRRTSHPSATRRTNPTAVTVPQAIAAASTVVITTSNPGSAATMVNINTADATALESLPGVGPSTAKAIVAHRQANGPFGAPEGLLEVKGIGESKLAAMRAFVTVS